MKPMMLPLLAVLTVGSFGSIYAQDKYVQVHEIELNGQRLEVGEFLVDLYETPKTPGIRAKSDREGFFIPAGFVDTNSKDIGVVLTVMPQRLRLYFNPISVSFLDFPWKIAIDTDPPFDSELLSGIDPTKIRMLYYLVPVGKSGKNIIVVRDGKPGVHLF